MSGSRGNVKGSQSSQSATTTAAVSASPADDDDWEAAELRIEQLSISNSSSQRKPSVVLPENFLADKNFDDGDFNFFSDDASRPATSATPDTPARHPLSSAGADSPGFEYAGGFQLQYNAGLASSSSSLSGYVQEGVPVEDALLDAIRSSKERMTALLIEKDVFDFVQSGRPSLDMPALNNRFRRLLVYKIAQRFFLEHRLAEYVTDAGDRQTLITLFRTPSTCPPAPLLIDIVRSMDEAAAAADKGSSGVQAASGSSSVPVKLMVRSRGSEREARRSAAKTAVSGEEREKKYIEARARIFGSEGTAAAAGDDADAALAVFEKEEGEGGDEGGGPGVGAAGGDSPSLERQADDVTAASSSSQRRWGKRSVMRNKDAEKCDPDFTRETAAAQFGYGGQYGAPLMMTVVGGAAYGAYSNSGYEQQGGWGPLGQGGGSNPYYSMLPRPPYDPYAAQRQEPRQPSQMKNTPPAPGYNDQFPPLP